MLYGSYILFSMLCRSRLIQHSTKIIQQTVLLKLNVVGLFAHVMLFFGFLEFHFIHLILSLALLKCSLVYIVSVIIGMNPKGIVNNNVKYWYKDSNETLMLFLAKNRLSAKLSEWNNLMKFLWKACSSWIVEFLWGEITYICKTSRMKYNILKFQWKGCTFFFNCWRKLLKI